MAWGRIGRGPGSLLPGRSAALPSLVIALGAVLVLGGWLYASPPGSSPDDGYHLGSIWCGAGIDDERCREVPGQPGRNVAFTPSALTQLTCVAGDGRRSASCQNDIYARFEGQYAVTDVNLTGIRAGLYYRAAHTFVSDDIPASIARIRVSNAVLALLLLASTAAIAAPDLRRAVLVSWLVASIPLGLFLITSLNSTAWGLAGLGTAWANAITALRPGERWRRGLAGLLALTGATMGLGSRTEAAAHLSVITVAVLLVWAADIRPGRRSVLAGRRRVTLALVIATIGLSLAFVIARFSAVPYLLGTTSGLSRGWDRLVARGISNPALTLAVEAPQLWTGALGTWSLGWLDTNMPSTVSVSGTVTFAVLATLGLLGASRGRAASAVVVILGLVALPVLSLLSIGLVVLELLQPRHYAPLLYVLLGLALLRSPGQPPLTIGRGTWITLGSVLTIGHAVALTININRYTRGLTEFLYVDTNRPIEWWWGGWAPSPDTVWLLGSTGYALVAFGVLSLLLPRSGTGRMAAPVG